MVDKSTVLDTLEDLLCEVIDYYELMQGHRYDLLWGGRWFNHPEVKRKIREIKRRALVRTAKELHRTEDARDCYVRRNHTGLLDASRTVYGIHNGESAWQRILDDADIVLPRTRQWNLKLLFDKLNSLGDKPEDFRHEDTYKKDSYLTMFAKKVFGSYGKAVMLIGIDFLSLPKVSGPKLKKAYQFTSDDFALIMSDEGLSDEEKTRAVFYGLSLQYYGFENYQSYIGRGVDLNEFILGRRHRFLSKISMSGQEYPCEEKSFSVFLELDKDIDARFHLTDFNFQGQNAEREYRRLREKISRQVFRL